jgi:predicted PurR-regulated permease PerM
MLTMRRDIRIRILVAGTAIVTAACVYVLAPFVMPEAIIMAMISASFPVAAWIAAARLRRAGRFADAELSLLWTFAAVFGFLLLWVLSNAQVERANESCAPARTR